MPSVTRVGDLSHDLPRASNHSAARPMNRIAGTSVTYMRGIPTQAFHTASSVTKLAYTDANVMMNRRVRTVGARLVERE